MTKARKLLIIALVGFLGVSIIFNVFQMVQTHGVRKELKKTQEQVLYYEDNYSPMYEYFTGLSVLEFEQKVANGEKMVVYFGRPDCGDCSTFEPMFTEVISEMGLTNNLYYVNVKWKREANTEQWENFKDVYGFSQTPAFVSYDFGQAQSMIEWTEKGLPKSELVAWLEAQGFTKA